jgi:DNA-binding LacI/PurR family transcriptional regulator
MISGLSSVSPVIRSTAELAAQLGLSRSTVSRVLNGQPGLSEKTLRRVQSAIAASGYTPNAHALHLRGKPSPVVGVCLENFATPTAVEKVSLLQQGLRQKGITALIEVLEQGASHRTMRHFQSLRVGAIVFIGHFEPQDLTQRVADLNRAGMPHLVIDSPGVPSANTISLDRAKAMAQTTAHLLKLGHRRFGLLGISGPYQTVHDRLTGFERALRRHGLEPAACSQSLDHLHHRSNHFEFGSLLGREFCRQRRMPTAFIAVNDDTAVGALLEFQAAGKRVPEDLSIIGFNNQTVCLVARPHLSSVDQQIAKTVEAAVDAIQRLLARGGAAAGAERLIAPKLVLRASTGPVDAGARPPRRLTASRVSVPNNDGAPSA